MDPVVALGVVSGLTDISNQVLLNLFKFKNAPKVSRELRDEIIATSTLLDAVSTMFVDSDSIMLVGNSTTLSSTVTALGETLQAINKRINLSTPSRVKRLLWPFTIRETQHLLFKMEQYKTTLSLLINVETAAQVKRLLLGSAQPDRITMDYKTTSADEWFRTLETTVLPQIDRMRRDDEPRVRIAILDTGVDQAHDEINFAIMKGKIAKSAGFPPTLNPLADSHGRGTHAASVVMRTAPNSVLYIARIADNDGAIDREDDYANTVKAIQWAIGLKVDIIAIGWGLAENSPDIARSLEMAKKCNIIIFAAASSSWAGSAVGFPARLERVAFCVGSADGLGNLSPSNPQPNGIEAFSVLGEAVRAAKAGSNDYIRRDGPEVGVMIACGVAALLLEYNSQVFRREHGADRWATMRNLLLAASTSTISRPYRLLLPTNLFSGTTLSHEVIRDNISQGSAIRRHLKIDITENINRSAGTHEETLNDQRAVGNSAAPLLVTAMPEDDFVGSGLASRTTHATVGVYTDELGLGTGSTPSPVSFGPHSPCPIAPVFVPATSNMAAAVSDNGTRRIRILSLDGGGVRGLSSLMILEHIMKKLQKQQKLSNVPLPCDYFDLICGTSTGGLIALMLGRLRLSVKECIKQYTKLAKEVFTTPKFKFGGRDKFDSHVLEGVLKRLVGSTLQSQHEGLSQSQRRGERSCDPLTAGEKEPLEDSLSLACCKTFVLAMHADAISDLPSRLRTYNSDQDFPAECTIWQAARATSAAPTFFDPVEFGDPPISYSDAGTGYNNPSREALAEANRIWPGIPIHLLVSIGTGSDAPPEINRSQIIFPGIRFKIEIAKALKKMVTNCEAIANDVWLSCKQQGIQYFRFSVPQGVGSIGLAEHKQMKRLAGLTNAYLIHGQTDQDVKIVTTSLVDS